MSVRACVFAIILSGSLAAGAKDRDGEAYADRGGEVAYMADTGGAASRLCNSCRWLSRTLAEMNDTNTIACAEKRAYQHTHMHTQTHQQRMTHTQTHNRNIST